MATVDAPIDTEFHTFHTASILRFWKSRNKVKRFWKVPQIIYTLIVTLTTLKSYISGISLNIVRIHFKWLI